MIDKVTKANVSRVFRFRRVVKVGMKELYLPKVSRCKKAVTI